MRRAIAVFLPALALWVTVTVAAGHARADVPPPDLCTSPGQPCQNAGAQYNQAGTCTATTCTKTLPNGDGGTTTMTYDCNLCRAMDGGTGGGGGGSSSGCAVAGGRGSTAAGGAASSLAFALLGIALVVRRRIAR